mgnify:FL=1
MINLNSDKIDFVNKCENSLEDIFKEIDDMELINSKKVLDAFHKFNLNENDLNGTTGYGYNDIGRDKIESIFSDIFKAEDALVRREFACASHALSISLSALLRHGNILLSITGLPYDTMHEVIGIKENNSSLISYGVKYEQIDLVNNDFDYEKVSKSLENVNLVYIQRSRGYSLRDSINIEKIEKVIKLIKDINKEIIIFVDNCYTEFVENKFPTEVGADIIVGSLIKNLGGGISTNGAYVAGKKDLIKLISERLYLPGEGKEVGPSINANRMFLMGLYLAPSVVASSLKSSILFSKVFEELGFQVSPKFNEKKSDIVEVIYLKNEENLINFCKTLQQSGPINSEVTPIPGDMPGYNNKIIMASPSFTTGSSIELSADAPLKDPYALFVQGGLSYSYAKLTLINILSNM